MQLQAPFFALLALVTTLPSASAAIWNDQLKVWDIGQVPSKPNHPDQAVDYWGACGGIPEGGYVCGWFESDGVNALRAIYSCVNTVLVINEVCGESARHNRCVKNSRRKGKKFYPFSNADRIVCESKGKVEQP